MSERDPRIDPMPGDVLDVVGNPKRKVARFGVNRIAVRYREVGMMQRKSHPVEIAMIQAWRKWAATAQIVKKAEG